MEQQVIEEGNKVIAEFVGLECIINDWVNYPKDNHDYTINLNGEFLCQYYGQKNDVFAKGILKYHSSWDWLMPVVEKINIMDDNEYDVIIFRRDCHINDRQQIIFESSVLKNTETLILIVWGCVVKFITWYNTQNK